MISLKLLRTSGNNDVIGTVYMPLRYSVEQLCGLIIALAHRNFKQVKILSPEGRSTFVLAHATILDYLCNFYVEKHIMY